MGSITGSSGRVEMTTATLAGAAGAVVIARVLGASRFKSLVVGGITAASMARSNRQRVTGASSKIVGSADN